MKKDRRELLLLGADETRYGAYSFGEVAAGVVGCLSVGADRTSPSLWAKGDPTSPNEDALLLAKKGVRVLMAVADSHFGIAASHEIVSRLHAACPSIPTSLQALEAVLRQLSSDPPRPRDRSASTLLVAVCDRRRRRGFGFSFGDSSLVVVEPHAEPRIVNELDHHYVSLFVPDGLEPGPASGFAFDLPHDGLVLAYTDGINECHYGHPATSVSLHHLRNLLAETGPFAQTYARRLMELALAGVDGNPGGQDNIALAVMETGRPLPSTRSRLGPARAEVSDPTLPRRFTGPWHPMRRASCRSRPR